MNQEIIKESNELFHMVKSLQDESVAQKKEIEKLKEKHEFLLETLMATLVKNMRWQELLK